MAKRGRKPKPYVTADRQKTIDGLYRYPGRDIWRVVETGQEFTEHDEALAISRFYELSAKTNPPVMIPVSNAPADPHQIADQIGTLGVEHLEVEFNREGPPHVRRGVQASGFWATVKSLLLHQRELIAQRTGLTVSIQADAGNAPPLAPLVESYCEHAGVGDAAQRRARRVWKDFLSTTRATTTADLTSQAVLRWADKVRAEGHAAVSVKAIFTSPGTVLRFAMKRGVDPKQIRQALDACAVLVAPKGAVTFDPHPITRADFAKLLKKADDFWRAALLLSLNAALYAKELLAVQWSLLDLNAGTYVSAREKTQIARVAVLWPRTSKALKKLKRQGDYVFVGGHGTPYHPNSFRKLFEDLRAAASVADTVKYSDLRDGAYSAACAAGIDINLCRVLAGHRSGISDHYYLRNPQMVRPATDAIDKVYFG